MVKATCMWMVATLMACRAAADRETTNFDFSWKFWHGPHPGYTPPAIQCPSSLFPTNLTGFRCDKQSRCAGGITVDECRNCACSDNAAVWQYSISQKSCWIGSMASCGNPDKDFISGGRPAPPSRGFQPVLPGPQKCPSSPTCGAFNDSSWRSLDVPHDFIVEGTFTPTADRGHGYLPFNVSWYRKSFLIPPTWAGKNIWVDFDGVYRASDYWLNGVYVGHHESGYTPFRWYLHNVTNATLHTDGTPNVLSVRVDALSHQEGWFYEGGGIYRHTKLSAADPVSIVPWGVYANSVIKPGSTVTGSLDEAQTSDGATASLQIDVANALQSPVEATISNILYDEAGNKLFDIITETTLNGSGWARIQQSMDFVAKPPEAGWVVQMGTCTGTPSQAFKVEANAISIQGADGTELCVDSGAVAPTFQGIQLQPCDSKKESQNFTFASTFKCGSGVCTNHIRASSPAGSCLDIYGKTGPGLDVFPCSNQPSQEFKPQSDEVSSIGLCLGAFPPSQKGHWVEHSHEIESVQLWNLVRPYLYTLVTSIQTNGPKNYSDSVNTTIGVRSAVFSANHGFLLNGLPQKVKGLSMHQDVGGCGTAVPDNCNEFRVLSLKSMGATGWRTAHNPVNSELLDFTDKHGLLVWSENRNLHRQVLAAEPPSSMVGGDWGGADPAYLEEAQAMVLRDRNHPSIIIWSLCNEAGCMQSDPNGGFVAAAFKNAIFEVDTSRPITANSEDRPGDTLTHMMDVNSFSYNYAEYDEYHLKYPFRTIIGGESASCTFDRGRYLGMGIRDNVTAGWVDADDTSCQISAWGTSAATRPWIVGNFAWTGWDYKGEPTPTNWPAINSHFGIIDIAGFPKDAYYYYASWWKNDTSVLHILPQDWNAPVPVGMPLDVVLFSAAATVELVVNGVSQGNQSVPTLGVVTYPNITFHPGSLVARSWDSSGVLLANSSVITTGPPAAIKLEVQIGSTLKSDGQDVAMVKVEIVDAKGNIVPDASSNVTFSVEGPGSIYGVANGDPVDHTPDKASYRSVFKGLARVLVQSKMSPGSITIHASSPGVNSGSVVIQSQ